MTKIPKAPVRAAAPADPAESDSRYCPKEYSTADQWLYALKAGAVAGAFIAVIWLMNRFAF